MQAPTCRHALFLFAALATAALGGCDRGGNDAAPKAAVARDTGGSLKGDFGPPQGKPIDAVFDASRLRPRGPRAMGERQ